MIMTRRSTLLVAALFAVLAGTVAFWSLRSSVRHALDTRVPTGRPLQSVASVDERRLETWGDATVRAAAITTSGLLTAGGSGVRGAGGRDPPAGLPPPRAGAPGGLRPPAPVG